MFLSQFFLSQELVKIFLISNGSDEVTTVAGQHRWYVEIFEAPEIGFVEKKDVKLLIDLIEKNIIK